MTYHAVVEIWPLGGTRPRDWQPWDLPYQSNPEESLLSSNARIPPSILRAPDEDARRQQTLEFIEDRRVATWLAGTKRGRERRVPAHNSHGPNGRT